MKNNFEFEIKSLEEKGTFEGYASVYNNLDHSGDIMMPGAFTKTLKAHKSKVVLLWQHEKNLPIGIVELIDSKDGLMVKGKINLETEKGREAYALIKQEAINKMSVGYNTIIDEYKNNTRLLKEVDLWEVSLVTFPANDLAQIISVKSDSLTLDETINEEEKETEMRQLTYSFIETIENIIENGIDVEAMITKCVDDLKAKILSLTKTEEKALNIELETKAGKKLSRSSMDKINQCKAILDELISTMASDENIEDATDKKDDVINIETKDITITDDEIIMQQIINDLKNFKL